MDLVTLADRWEQNQESLKQHLGVCGVTPFGARWVSMPTAPHPRFNHVSCVRIASDQVESLVASARAFFQESGVGSVAFLITPATQPADLGPRLLQLGFWGETVPVMVWDGRPLPPHQRPELQVLRLTAGQNDLFWEVLRQVFFVGATPPALQAGRHGVDVATSLGAINYLALVGGNPAGVGTLYPYGQMGGIYNMCTLPRYERLGVASAIMRACIADAQAIGCTQIALTPTEMGHPLYERLGFQERYHEVYLSQRIER